MLHRMNEEEAGKLMFISAVCFVAVAGFVMLMLPVAALKIIAGRD